MKLAMKKVFKSMCKKSALFLAVAACVGLCGCGGEKVTYYDTAQNFITAWQTGDVQGLRDIMVEDHTWLPVLDAVESGSNEGLDAVYREAFKKVQETVIELEETTSENQFYYKTTITAPMIYSYMYRAMQEAITDQVENGSDAFVDYTTWMCEGIKNAEKSTEPDETNIYMTLEDGKLYVDDSENFFDDITGDFTYFMDSTMVCCSYEDETSVSKMYMFAVDDELIAMVEYDGFSVDTTGWSDEDLEYYLQSCVDMYSVDGMCASASIEDNWMEMNIGVDFNTVSSQTLVLMGMLDDSLGYSDYISLEATVEGFEESGWTTEVIF